MNAHLWKWILAICLLVFGTRFANTIIPSTFGYDGEIQAAVEYDASRDHPVSSYVGGAMLATPESAKQSTGTHALFVNFTKFLAAEGTASITTPYAVEADVWQGVQRAASGQGGPTDWELLQIQQNPQSWDTLQFWKGGQPAPNPFK